MQNDSSSRVAQSASALGAAIFGFGAGIQFGFHLKGFGLWIIVVGAILHVSGMYIMQMKARSEKTGIARFLLISAWVCLLGLIAIIIYLSIKK